MLLIPVLALLLAAGITWWIGSRPSRIQWVVNVLFGFLVWLLSLVLLIAIPNEVSVALWRPAEIFIPPFELRLDQASWSLVYAAATVLLAVILTSAARVVIASPSQRAYWFAFTALAVLAFFASNLLTAIIAISLIDLFSLIFFIQQTDRATDIRQAIVRIGIDLSGTLLFVAAAWVSAVDGGGTGFDQVSMTTPAASLFILGILLRLGFIPLYPTLSFLPKGAGTLLYLFPPAIAISLLARSLESGSSPTVKLWLFIAGSIGLILGGMRWLLEENRDLARPNLVIGLAGLGMLVSSIPNVKGDVLFVTGILLLLVGSLLSLIEIYTPSHRLWPVLAVALLVGLPITPGGHIASVVGQSILEEGAWIQALLVIPGMSFLALGTFHLFFTEEKPWNSGETLIRVMYSMGLALPVLVCIGLGFWMRTTISVSGVVVSAVVVGLGVGEFYGLRKISGVRRFERWKSLILRLNLRWFYTLLWNIIRQSLAIARSIGELFEGEGAMLWMFAFVALLFLALR